MDQVSVTHRSIMAEINPLRPLERRNLMCLHREVYKVLSTFANAVDVVILDVDDIYATSCAYIWVSRVIKSSLPLKMSWMHVNV